MVEVTNKMEELREKAKFKRELELQDKQWEMY